LSECANNRQTIARNAAYADKTSGLLKIAGITFCIIQQALCLLTIKVVT
jgi:hypothetical protein